MADTVYARLLVRALEIEGSAQSLAQILRVPEATMLRWRTGRAFMPMRAFQKLISYLAEAERNGVTGSAPAQPRATGQSLTFRIGKVVAHCTQCDGTEFRLAEPEVQIRIVSALRCCLCGMEVIYGDLLMAIAAIASKPNDETSRARRRRARIAGQTGLRPPEPTAGRK
jgi:hypothetical protein